MTAASAVATVGRSPTARARALLELVRPRVVAVVLLTAPPVLLADGSSPVAAAGALVGTALLASGCSAANACWEHEADGRMDRTRGRPLPSGRIGLVEARLFAGALLALSLLALSATGGALAGVLGVATTAVYLGAYTAWLKPRSAWQVPVGALAGAAAPLLADSADGDLSALGLALFALVAIWQLPHAWAISLFRRGDYAAAGVVVLPDAVGEPNTRAGVLAGAIVTAGASLAPVATGSAGPVYLAASLGLGAWFVGSALRAVRRGSHADDRAVFVASIVQLTALFLTLTLELALWR